MTPTSASPTTVAVKITDMLGEEVLVTKQIDYDEKERTPFLIPGRVASIMPLEVRAMARPHLGVPAETIADRCRRHHIRKLSFFGSVLREDFGAESDVGMLVEFEPAHIPGFLRLYGVEQELSELLGGRRVDLVTEKFLNRRIRDGVLATAEVCYTEG